MKQLLKYSFDDEPVRKFCLDLSVKRIEVHFSGYHDLVKNILIEVPCIWVIESWEDAKCKVGEGSKLFDLYDVIGVFKLILYAKYNEFGHFEILVNTVDNRYLTIFFKGAKMNLCKSES